tara:strand:+ start:20008 stop:20178 length:171 start_codon:yes stop_codon:yes gene_type:complete
MNFQAGDLFRKRNRAAGIVIVLSNKEYAVKYPGRPWKIHELTAWAMNVIRRWEKIG